MTVDELTHIVAKSVNSIMTFESKDDWDNADRVASNTTNEMPIIIRIEDIIKTAIILVAMLNFENIWLIPVIIA